MADRGIRLFRAVSACLVATAGVVAGQIGVSLPATAEAYVAGVEPWRRPQAAPSSARFEKTAQWMAWAARGVAEPRPASLKFLDDQGGWYTPFTVRGMPGRYDIRGLHALPPSPPIGSTKGN